MLFKNTINILKTINNNFLKINNNLFHTSSVLEKSWNTYNSGPRKWLEYNKKIYPPQLSNEEPRKAVTY